MSTFVMRAAQADIEGYYYTRWDTATPIEVKAETKQEAIDKAVKILGPPRSGRYWTFEIDKIIEDTTVRA